MNRRTFITGLSGILAASQAPAIVTQGVLMPVRQIWTPEFIVTGMTIADQRYDFLTPFEFGKDDVLSWGVGPDSISLQRNGERLKTVVREVKYPFISSVITDEWSNQHILDAP